MNVFALFSFVLACILWLKTAFPAIRMSQLLHLLGSWHPKVDKFNVWLSIWPFAELCTYSMQTFAETIFFSILLVSICRIVCISAMLYYAYLPKVFPARLILGKMGSWVLAHLIVNLNNHLPHIFSARIQYICGDIFANADKLGLNWSVSYSHLELCLRSWLFKSFMTLTYSRLAFSVCLVLQLDKDIKCFDSPICQQVVYMLITWFCVEELLHICKACPGM